MSRDAKWYADWGRLLPASSVDEKMRNREAADLLEDLAERVPCWISVEERMPERYTDVAIIERDGVHWWYKVAYLGACDVWALNGGRRVLGDVTHWMPLPEPPEEGAK